jgi:(2Fe-2S) ferredoxin
MFDLHIFVCQRKRTLPKSGCGNLGSEALRSSFKQAFKDKNAPVTVRVNEAGCLNHCEKGPVVVAYPQGKWFYHVELSQIPDIVDALLELKKK